MNIDEIRAEIPKAFSLNYEDTFQWALENIKENIEGISLYKVRQIVAEEFVDWAYEAGKAEQLGQDRKTGEQIIAEMREQYEIGFEAGKADCQRCNKTGYQDGFDDAAKDPKAWYVLGANNLPIHIGDTVKSTDPELDNEWDYEEVTGFNFRFDRPQLEYRLGHDYADEMVKVTPDSWDKFKQDLYRHLHGDNEEYIYDHRTCEDLSRELIARAKKLAEVD